jgi:hypothetical protein
MKPEDEGLLLAHGHGELAALRSDVPHPMVHLLNIYMWDAIKDIIGEDLGVLAWREVVLSSLIDDHASSCKGVTAGLSLMMDHAARWLRIPPGSFAHRLGIRVGEVRMAQLRAVHRDVRWTFLGAGQVHLRELCLKVVPPGVADTALQRGLVVDVEAHGGYGTDLHCGLVHGVALGMGLEMEVRLIRSSGIGSVPCIFRISC